MFYSLSVLIAINRILYFSSYIYYFNHDFKDDPDVLERVTAVRLYLITNDIAFISKAVLGVFQCGSMTELGNEMKHSARKIDT